MDKNQDALSLIAQLGKFQNMPDTLPPIDQWSPELSGDMDMLIKADGSWIHEGDTIKREKLVRLFSTILKKEAGEYFLVTPVEKWRIQVEELPFVIVLANIKGDNKKQEITLLSNLGDEINLNQKDQIQLNDQSMPFIEVRSGLYAKINRNVYYQLAEVSRESEGGQFYIQSSGIEHRIG